MNLKYDIQFFIYSVVTDFSSTNEFKGDLLSIVEEVQNSRLLRTKRKSTHLENSLQDKDGQGLSKMTPDPIPPKIERH